jgi:DNA polymerase-3 subunit epsilon
MMVAMEPSVLEPRLASGWRPRAFAAIDFEMANRSRASACAVSIVRVEGRRIAKRTVSLIRPPTSQFEFTHIHGITWAHVATKRAFAEVWKTLAPMIEGAEFLAAHNAQFDHGVLVTCCRNTRIAVPDCPFVCTVALARLKWGLYPTKLLCGEESQLESRAVALGVREHRSALNLDSLGTRSAAARGVPASRSTPAQNRVSAIWYCSLRPQPLSHIATEGDDHVRAATS